MKINLLSQFANAASTWWYMRRRRDTYSNDSDSITFMLVGVGLIALIVCLLLAVRYMRMRRWRIK